jgi:competence ComEA-like helix-hairpin-helix protein
VPSRRASALVVVLWCVAVLGVVVISTAHTATLEIRLARNAGDSVQAYFLALAGIEKAKALIYRETRPHDPRQSHARHRAGLYDNPGELEDVRLGGGVFRVVRAAREGDGRAGLVYGIEDTESRLDVNHASAAELARLPGMDEALAAAIVDWRDDDAELSPNGAEAEYYASLSPPFSIRNGPVETLRDLLRVRGMTSTFLLGEDRNANGLLDPEEDDGAASFPPDDRDGYLDRGLSAYLSLESSVPNESARGEDRVDVTRATADELAQVDGITQEVARAIVAHRDRQRIESLADLLEVTSAAPSGGVPTAAPPGPAGEARVVASRAGSAEAPGLPVTVFESFRSDIEVDSTGVVPVVNPAAGESAPAQEGVPAAAGGGEKLISVDLLQRIADDITVSDELRLEGVVNINTASWEVLASLEGLNESLARAIVDHRQSAGPFASAADLLDVPGVTVEVFKQVGGRVTARGGTFRVTAEGIVPSSGARRRVEAVVRLGAFDFDTLYYREEP